MFLFLFLFHNSCVACAVVDTEKEEEEDSLGNNNNNNDTTTIDPPSHKMTNPVPSPVPSHGLIVVSRVRVRVVFYNSCVCVCVCVCVWLIVVCIILSHPISSSCSAVPVCAVKGVVLLLLFIVPSVGLVLLLLLHRIFDGISSFSVWLIVVCIICCIQLGRLLLLFRRAVC